MAFGEMQSHDFQSHDFQSPDFQPHDFQSEDGSGNQDGSGNPYRSSNPFGSGIPISELFEASITIVCSRRHRLLSQLAGHLQDADVILDGLIREAQDPLQRSQLARLARALHKASDASSVLR